MAETKMQNAKGTVEHIEKKVFKTGTVKYIITMQGGQYSLWGKTYDAKNGAELIQEGKTIYLGFVENENEWNGNITTEKVILHFTDESPKGKKALNMDEVRAHFDVMFDKASEAGKDLTDKIWVFNALKKFEPRTFEKLMNVFKEATENSNPDESKE